MRVDASEFEGSFALGARIEGDSTGGFLRIGSDGGAQLVARREGKEQTLDEATAPLSGGEMTIGLSAVGRHWKGFADGQTVVHGHARLPGAGRTGLLLDGSGTIRLFWVRIAPVNTAVTPNGKGRASGRCWSPRLHHRLRQALFSSPDRETRLISDAAVFVAVMLLDEMNGHAALEHVRDRRMVESADAALLHPRSPKIEWHGDPTADMLTVHMTRDALRALRCSARTIPERDVPGDS
jgi:hypothetical protein